MPDWTRRCDIGKPWSFDVASERFDDDRASPAVRALLESGSGHRAGGFFVAARRRDDADVAAGQLHEHGGAVSGRRLHHCRRGFAAQEVGQRRGVNDPPHDRIVGVGGGDQRFARAGGGEARARLVCISAIAFRAELVEDRLGLVEIALRDRAGAAA